jgi:predicted SAM-dependent methyltransferase
MTPLKLNVGSADVCLPGYTNIDRKHGGEAFPLTYNDGTPVADESVDEILASHVLEHFGHNEVGNVVQDWARCLKNGGKLRVAVPDFTWIARAHFKRDGRPYYAYLLGGQKDADDFHKCAFDRETLSSLLRQCGLHRVREWKSTNPDCSALPVSLNLEATKGVVLNLRHPLPRVHAVVSLPRLGFTSTQFCALGTTQLLGIPFRKQEGVYWEQCIERAIGHLLDDVPDLDYVLTIDYDSVFSPQDVATLCDLAVEHPEADAIAPVQVRRREGGIMAWLFGPDGRPLPVDTKLTKEHYAGDLVKCYTAHFGLTLLKASKFKNLPRPWFRSRPGANGEWGLDRLDADVAFWAQWHEAGNSLYLASRVPIGHNQLVVTWPTDQLGVTHQECEAYWNEGEPADVWT